MSEDTIYFNGPVSEEDYKGPNIHDIDPYDALLRARLEILAQNQQKEEKN